MVSNGQKLLMVKPRAKTSYERWIEKEGVSIIDGFGVSDVRRLSFQPWRRLGCDGAYLQLRGLGGITGVYVARLGPQAMTEPEKHLYEKVIYAVEGEGAAEFQQRDRLPQSVSWKAGSLFAPPLNATHRFINYSNHPAILLAVTTAPLVLDHFHNEQFVFSSDFSFSDRYDGEDDYFNGGERRYLSANNGQWIWETNFVPDLGKAAADAPQSRRAAVHMTKFEMANNALAARLFEWPAGRYHKARRQESAGGALVMLRSQGYSLMWPSDWGTRPYEKGCADRVVRINWSCGNVLSVPANWFYQHFNTGPEPALQLALRCESHRFPLGIGLAPNRAGVYDPSKTVIEYEDEDLTIRRLYEGELRRRGIVPEMSFELAANDD